MKTKIVIVLFVCLSFINCSEDKDDFPNELPAITQEGKDTAGCLVDGELVLKRGRTGGFPSSPLVTVVKPKPGIDVWQLNLRFVDNFFNDRSSASITIVIKSETELKENKVYELLEFVTDDKNTGEGDLFFKPKNENTLFSAKTDLNNRGELTITKIELEGDVPFIAGTFEFQANSGEGRVFSVTDGRFDLKIGEIK
ncbi:hypothetical protein [uncultured Tenacibaculum sp.]|uniref:hypothetical protein n=1 Tax=uncultured Tenacibaculum sp. TaxID=174713 RepID=UPI00260B6A15|nr:hypothetical protein [uncultured Tenacibaculum sp.]